MCYPLCISRIIHRSSLQPPCECPCQHPGVDLQRRLHCSHSTWLPSCSAHRWTLAWHQGHGASACTARTAHIGVCAPQQLPKVRSLACWNVQLNQHTARLLSSFLSALRSMPHCCTTAVSSPFVSPCRAATQHPPGLQGAHIRPPKSLQPAGGWLLPYLCTHNTTLLLWRQQVPRQGSATLSSSTSGRRAHTPKWCTYPSHV